MTEQMESKHELITRWLRVLIYIDIASIINSVVNYLPFMSAPVTTWISRGIMVAMVVCMFRLAPVNKRYKKAGIFRAVMLVCALITAFLFGSTLLTLAASIFSILSVYQEYSGHSELIADKDPKLSKNWHSLFNWGIVAAILVSFGSFVAVLIIVILEMDTVRTSNIIVGVLSVPQFVIDVVYLLYIKKMVQIFHCEGEVDKHDA